MSWGIYEETDDSGSFVAFHNVPMVKIDEEEMVSAAHDLSDTCPCHPLFTRTPLGYILWCHHDPDHAGALTEDEWERKKNGWERN